MELHFSFMRFSTSIAVTILFFSNAASADSSYSWQSVQQNMRMRSGDYQTETSNEDSCKARCVQNPRCIGVDWHAGLSSCFLFYDPNASPYSANGFLHWRIIRNRSTSIISKGTYATLLGTPAATTAATTATTAMPVTPATTTRATTTTRRNIPVAITNKTVISKELLTRQTQDTSTLKTSTTSGRSATSDQTLLSDIPDINTDDVNNFYLWQPVKLDMRSRTGNYQTGIPNEDSCKALCGQTPDCTGIDWHNSTTMCVLLNDCNASLNTQIGSHHWEIRRYKSTPITCQDLVRREVPPPNPLASMLCHSQDNLTTVKVLSVLLGFATVVIAVLMFNTWRLHQKIRSCTCQVKKVNFAQKAQENGYQSYNGTATQPAPYTDMVRTLPPIPNEVEIVYAAIDEDIHA